MLLRDSLSGVGDIRSVLPEQTDADLSEEAGSDLICTCIQPGPGCVISAVIGWNPMVFSLLDGCFINSEEETLGYASSTGSSLTYIWIT